MPDFFIAYYTTDEYEEFVKRVDSDGAEVSQAAIGESLSAAPLIAVGDGFAIHDSFNGVSRYDNAGAFMWTSAQPETGAWNGVADGDGNIYTTGQDGTDLFVYKTDSSGNVTQLATTGLAAAGVPTDVSFGFGIALSQDRSVAIITYRKNGQNGMLALDLVGGGHLWTQSISTPLGNGGLPQIVRAPSGNVFFTATADNDTDGDQIIVSRWDFPSGIDSAPTETWSTPVTGDENFYSVQALIATTDRVIVGYDWISEFGGGGPHCVTALTHAGAVEWRWGTENAYLEQFSLGANESKVIVGVWEWEMFPTTAAGYVMLDTTTGSEATVGLFPLESGSPGGVATLVGSLTPDFPAGPWYEQGNIVFDPTPPPNTLNGVAYVVHDRRLFMLGGYDFDWVETAKVYSYDPFENAWETHTDLPWADAQYENFASLNGLIYGMSFNEDKFYSYNPETGVTTDLASPSYAGDKWGYGLVAAAGKIYYAMSSAAPEVYDPQTNTWAFVSTTGANSPSTEGLARYGSFEFDGTYIWTHLFGVVRRYDPATDTWTSGWTNSLSVFSQRLAWEVTLLHDGKLYLIGGYDADTGDLVPELWNFDPATDTWTKLDAPPEPARGDVAAGMIDGRIIFATGADADFNSVSDIALWMESLPLLRAENEYHVLPTSITNEYVNQPAIAFLVNRYDSPTPAVASVSNSYDNRAYVRKLTNSYGNVESVPVSNRAQIMVKVRRA